MNTGSSGDRTVEAFRHIDSISHNVPIARILNELQLVVERLTFSRLSEREVQNDPATTSELDLFFRDEVSTGMVEFIHWMAGRNQLADLAGSQGRIFLDRCVTAYRTIREVQFVTAIDLDDAHKATITQRLREVYPSPARILFSTSPSVMAGFVIQEGVTAIDKSLRTHVTSSLSKSTKLEAMTGE